MKKPSTLIYQHLQLLTERHQSQLLPLPSHSTSSRIPINFSLAKYSPQSSSPPSLSALRTSTSSTVDRLRRQALSNNPRKRAARGN